ncbi:MAG: hypothetical protein ISR77_20155 [Pirellulaceae bacterium]|nr:hypothetical protein [Pirellulaceae bacterium]
MRAYQALWHGETTVKLPPMLIELVHGHDYIPVHGSVGAGLLRCKRSYRDLSAWHHRRTGLPQGYAARNIHFFSTKEIEAD